jgi:hypothetical protein
MGDGAGVKTQLDRFELIGLKSCFKTTIEQFDFTDFLISLSLNNTDVASCFIDQSVMK